MTAFNNVQPDKEQHHHLSHTDKDGEAHQIKERTTSTSSDFQQPLCAWSSFSCDAGLLQSSLVKLENKRQFCRRCCYEEGCGSMELKDTRKNNMGSADICSHCLLESEASDALMSKQEVLCFLKHELEQERIAAESAANEAIAMILRLQAEKAALQMEARHYQQLLEARTLYDEETIFQLKDIISSQEADRLVLEREINECKQTLHKYSQIVMDKGRQGGHLGHKVDGEDLLMAAMVPSCTQKTVGGLSRLESGGSLRPLSLEEKFNSAAIQPVENAQQSELSSLETKDEAKTKYVVSFSTSDPILNAASRVSALEGSRMHDCQLGSLELEGVKVDSLSIEGNCLNDVVKDCWLSILIQLSNLQKQIWNSGAVGFSGVEADHMLVKHQECCLNSSDGLTELEQKLPLKYADCGQEFLCGACVPDAFHLKEYNISQYLSLQNREGGVEMLPRMSDSCWAIPAWRSEHTNKVVNGEVLFWLDNKNSKVLHQHGEIGDAHIHAHLDPWSDLMAITDSCAMALEENFATCQRRLHALEAARKAMAEALKTTKENMGKADKVLVIAADMMKDFLSFTGLGCDILDLLHNLVTHLTKVARLEARFAETDLGSNSKLNTCVMTHDNRPLVDEEGPETVPTSIQSDSYIPQHMDSKMSKFAYLWSSSLEWMSNEKCRAETAFSGWDHI